MEIEKGPFAIFDHRPNVINLQRFIVPWLIAIYGLSYPKTMEPVVLKEMLIAIIDQNKLLGLIRALSSLNSMQLLFRIS